MAQSICKVPPLLEIPVQEGLPVYLEVVRSSLVREELQPAEESTPATRPFSSVPRPSQTTTRWEAVRSDLSSTVCPRETESGVPCFCLPARPESFRGRCLQPTLLLVVMGGKYSASGEGRGGAVFSAGNLRIAETTFANNRATGGSGSAPSPGRGGGVYSTGQLELNGCALLSNYAIGGNTENAAYGARRPGAGQGGGIWSSGPLAATNSTVTANDAIGGVNLYGGATGGPGNGGGIASRERPRVLST